MAQCPDIKIERLDDFWIAREDLLPGGTKRRALLKYLPTLNSNHFIYAGSVYGSGGWALAEACRDLGYSCTLVLSKAHYRPHWLDAIRCEIEWVDPQPVEMIYNNLQDRKGLLPLGYNEPLFMNCLAEVFRGITISAPEIWMPCVSGTLIRSAQLAWPDIKMNAVCLAKHHGDLGHAVKYQAEEKYHQSAKLLPPYPANAFSDAKLWQFVSQLAAKNALIWNTSL